MHVERLDPDALQRLGDATEIAAYLRAHVTTPSSVADAVRNIIEAVRERKDAAVEDFTRQFDLAGAEAKPLLVAEQELDQAIRQLDLDLVAGLQVSIANVAQIAQAGIAGDTTLELPQGQHIRLRELPVRSAAVYVPGGRAPYPSTAVMGVVTARAAGVIDVAVCSPPGPGGDIHPAILGACRLLGVQRVYRMGGAQAIAALAHGTETVNRVDVIVGPGNLYVQEAKLQLSSVVGIDGFAGPSDLLVVLGEGADTRLAALDLLAQAEHGHGSLVVAVSPSKPLLDTLTEEIQRLAEQHAELDFAACVLVQAADARQAIELANAFAPEHLQLVGAEIEALAPAVQSAGCLLVGPASATAFGDYVAGSNHILPTGGAARFASSLSARHFRRRMAEVRIDSAAGRLAAAAIPIAEIEGFRMHAESMRARIGENERP